MTGPRPRIRLLYPGTGLWFSGHARTVESVQVFCKHYRTWESRTEGDSLALHQYSAKDGDLPRVRIPAGQSVARSEATRVAKEEMNAVNCSGVRAPLGAPATMQGVTWVDAERTRHCGSSTDVPGEAIQTAGFSADS